MSRLTLGALRVLLALLFAGAIAAQVASVAIPTSVLAEGEAVVLTGLMIAGAVAVEVVLFCAWMLVGLVPGDTIFDERGHADTWVQVAIVALWSGAALGIVGFVVFAVAESVAHTPSGPTLLVLSAAAAGVGAALALLVGVMRRLLRTAMRLQSELAEVI